MCNVLDQNYTPLTQEEVNLFNEKHKLTHFIFSATSQTNRCKKFVREYEDEFDTQNSIKSCMDFAQRL